MKSILTAILVIPLLVCTTAAMVPETMSYQGVLVDNNGVIVADNNYSMTFKIYTVPSAGSEIWTETQSVAVVGGRFNVILGSNNALTIDFDVPYWLGITVVGDPEMTPRVELASTPYALNARTVMDSAVTGVKIKDGQVVRSANGLTDDVIVAGGDNVTVTTSNDSIIVSSALGIPTTTRYFSIPAEEINPNSSSTAYVRNTVHVYSNAAGIASFGAGVHLPHGAVVTEMSALVDDTSAGHEVSILVRGMHLSTGSIISVASVASGVAFDAGLTTITDDFINNSTIDNDNYAYSLQMSFTGGGGSLVKFKGLRLTYEINEPLP